MSNPNFSNPLADWVPREQYVTDHPDFLSEYRSKRLVAEREFNGLQKARGVMIWRGKAYFHRIRFPEWLESQVVGGA